MKQRIQLKESQLKAMIAESVRNVLKEWDEYPADNGYCSDLSNDVKQLLKSIYKPLMELQSMIQNKYDSISDDDWENLGNVYPKGMEIENVRAWVDDALTKVDYWIGDDYYNGRI